MMGVQEESDVEMADNEGHHAPTVGANEPFREGITEKWINSNSSSSSSGEYTNHQRVARRSHDYESTTSTSFVEDRPTKKRIKENETPSFSNITAAMETATLPSSSASAAQLPSSDDILIEMIRQQQQTSCGGGGPFNVVEFCQSTGIPLSRMLRLDLMRLDKPSSTSATSK